jgi:hypothetical protein
MVAIELGLNYEGLRFMEKYKNVIESGGNLLEIFRKKDISSIEKEVIIHDIGLMEVVRTSLNNIKDSFEREVRKLGNSLKEPFLFLPKEIQGVYRDYLSEGKNCIIFLNQVIGQLENYKEKYQKEFEGR